MTRITGLGLAVISMLMACGGGSSSSPNATPPDDEAPDAEAAGGSGGQTVKPKADAAAPDLAAGTPDLGRPEILAVILDAYPPAPDVSPDIAPPLGEFPLEAVKAGRFQQLSRVSTHTEGPSYRDGNVYFASDGNGLVRADATGKVFRYHPRLAPVGSYLLADGSLIVCDKGYTVVQVFPDGSVGALLTEAEHQRIDFCNDVTVDPRGNIYFTQARAGDIWRITPEGMLDKVTGGHDYPNGVEIDREGKYLYFSTRMLMRMTIPETGTGFGAPQAVGPAGVDGMAFDAWGNLWVAIYNGGGEVRVLDVARRQTIATLDVPNATNLTFGGPGGDTVFVTGANRGLFRVTISGIRGFLHPGAPKYTIKRMLDLKPVDTPL
jgi:gluconolactonase